MSPRPARIDRRAVVDGTLTLLDEVGPDAFSMRRLGAHLSVDPMTIYHHVPSRAALFDAVADRIWQDAAAQAEADGDDAAAGPVPAEGTEPPWERAVTDVCRALRRSLLRHPSVIRIVATRPAVSPAQLQLADRVVSRLAERGLDPAESMRLLDCTVAFTVGKVQGELRDPLGGVDRDPGEVWATMDAEALPHLSGVLEAGYAWEPEAEFDRGLTALVRGWRPQA